MGEPDLSDMPAPTNGAEIYLRAILGELRAQRREVAVLPGTVELREPDIRTAVNRAKAKSSGFRGR